MSNDDYMVDPLSNSDVREHARRLRRFLTLDDAERIDPLALEKVSEIWTVAGVKPFRFEAVADDDLPNDSGLTTYDGSALLIQIPRRIRHDAFMGDGYARYTIAHELGHAILHLDKLMQGAAMPASATRLQTGFRSSNPPNTKPWYSAAPSSSMMNEPFEAAVRA